MLSANTLLKLLQIFFSFLFIFWVELIGGGLAASRSLVELLFPAVRGFTSRVLDSGVFNFGLLGPLPPWAVVYKWWGGMWMPRLVLSDSATDIQRGLQCIWKREVGRTPHPLISFVLFHSIQYSLLKLLSECWTNKTVLSAMQLVNLSKRAVILL